MRPLTIETVEALGDGHRSADHRRSAFETFAAAPMPSEKDEDWRYVDLELDLDALAVPEAPGTALPEDEFVAAVSDPAGRATIVDGFVVRTDHETPARFGSGDPIDDGLIPPSIDKFAAAHHAFSSEGLVLDVPAGAAVDQPFLVDLQAVTEGSISFPAVTVSVGENAEAAVVLATRSPDDLTAAIIPHVALHVGPGSRLRFTTAQVLGNRTTSVTHQRARADRDAVLRLGEVGLGGRFSRLDLGVELAGNGSSTEVVGVYFGEYEQVLDYRMVITHVGRNTTSDVFLKGAVEDEARSVFTGLLRIERDAVRTNAFETNRNLVLSPGAKAHSVPNLEILCNDVMCGHGSSVGPLDEEHIYYLQTRGLSRGRAERVLVRGFFSEAIDRLPAPRLAGPIARVVNRRFVEAQAEGRLA